MSERDEAYLDWLAQMRPRLHPYCARMTGSAVDGEDAVQETLIKAMQAASSMEAIANREAWLFRVAHNSALDLVRQQLRNRARSEDFDIDEVADPLSLREARPGARASLQAFMVLPPLQRSAVILMDVFEYSLQEIGDITGQTIASIKAALHRGRARLRSLAPDFDGAQAELDPSARSLLEAYVEHFNHRDFDRIRAMLAEEVRLDLVARTRLAGRREVGGYFSRYSEVANWRMAAGMVDGRPAVIATEDGDATPRYIIVLDWRDAELLGIRDFRYARYVMDSVSVKPLPPR